ncbi:MAG: Rho termination factor N-terminal domain-containing protein, partial [Deinococcales bacterium]
MKPRKRGRPRKQESGADSAPGTDGAVEAKAEAQQADGGADVDEAQRSPGGGDKKGGRSGGGRKSGSNGKSKGSKGGEAKGEASRDEGADQGSGDQRSGDQGSTAATKEREGGGEEQEERGRGGRGGRNRRGRSGGGRKGGLNFRELQSKIVPELHLLAKEVGLEDYRQMSKDDLALA